MAGGGWARWWWQVGDGRGGSRWGMGVVAMGGWECDAEEWVMKKNKVWVTLGVALKLFFFQIIISISLVHFTLCRYM